MAADAVLVGKGGAPSGTTVTTAGGTTSATGSTFVIALTFDGVRNVTSVSDSKGNTYTEIGTKQASSNAGTAMYRCENGIGGASHTATANFSAAAYQVAYLIELTGVETSSFDQTAVATDAATPWEITTPTLGQADEIIITSFCLNTAGSGAYSSGNTTIIGEEQDGAAYYGGVVSKLVVSATTAVTPSFTRSAGSGTGVLKTATFKASASATNYTLTAAQGSFSLTGQAATLTKAGGGYTLTADQGSFTLNGSPAYRDISMTAAQGAFAMTGRAAGFVMARKLTADQGSSSLNGQSAGLIWSGAPVPTYVLGRPQRRARYRQRA